ncbi:MAG: transporter substrate-binding domain-containing protein [Oscillospiraceae bacterium]
MKTTKRAAALLLCICLLALSACGGGSDSATYGRYKSLAVFDTEQFSIGFRKDDFLRYYVDAAIKTLAADGTLHSIALRWFAEDTTTFVSDAAALEKIGNIPTRDLIVGVDEDAFPMSYVEGEKYLGFDVDMVKAVCDKLSWSVKFLPIKAADAYVELSSGNIDMAWGGLALDPLSKNYSVLPPYMTNELVLLTRVDSGIRSKAKLSGKTLAIDVDQKYMDALDSDPALKDSLGKIKRLTGGAQKCFAELDAGTADAAIVYAVAARYYGK